MKRNPYTAICEFLDDAIQDEAEGIAFYEEFRKLAERSGLVTLEAHLQQVMDDEEEHMALMLAFRKTLCGKKK